jgi:predicted ATPase
LQATRLPLEEAVPLMAALLSVPLAARYSPLDWSPQKHKQKTQEALVAWLVAEAERQPVLAVWEDLHWTDPSTLELLGLVLDQTPTASLCTLLTCRPEFSPPWTLRSYLTQLTLTRLTRPQVEEMVQRITGGKALPAEVAQQIVAKTDGVPLFVEELTKMVLESSLLREREDHYELTGPLPLLAIPTTLQDALMARLDRLTEGKAVAQPGAVLGRTFSYELLQAVASLDELALWRGLVQLVQAEVLYQRGVLPRATYTFKHALLQEAAYQSLLRSTRQQYHQRTAQVVAERFPDLAETQPELLAQHYTEAGLSALAMPYWQQAGERALQRSAHVEAIAHLSRGLGLLETLPPTPERTQQAIVLYSALGGALMATKGYAAPEVEQAYRQAYQLCQQAGDPGPLFPVLAGLALFYSVRAEHQTAHDLAEQLLTLAQDQPEPVFRLRAHTTLAANLFYLGELAMAQAQADQGIALYDRQQHRSLVSLYGGNDPGVACLAEAAMIQWLLGYPDQALQRSREALALSQELAHPFSRAFALIWVTWFHLQRRDWQAAAALLEALIALCTEQGFAFYLAGGMALRGCALAGQGRVEEGVAEIRQGLAAMRATGAETARRWFLAHLAEAYGQSGQAAEGLTLLAEALASVPTTGEHYWEPELYRLQGELRLQSGVPGLEPRGFTPHSALRIPHAAEAAACLQQALTIARQQQAKSLELRAALSLSRLWQHQGKQDAARELLTPIYGWFTEGFDTADLQEAKSLLDELA